jgi:exopolysaccharide biosynthesis polyprenyl glycosylphosphotransferase
MRLQRYSVNYSIFSIIMDGISIVVSLIATIYLRIGMNRLSFITPMDIPTRLPVYIFILFPIIWIIVLSTFSIYDVSKYVRVVDEFTALSLGAFIAAMCQAGVIYLSTRDISRAYFIVYIFVAVIISIGWRSIARLVFRMDLQSNQNIRRVVIVRSENSSRNDKLIKQLQHENENDLVICEILHSDSSSQGRVKLNDPEFSRVLRQSLAINQATDTIFIVKPVDYSTMGELVENLDDLQVDIHVTLDFSEIALFQSRVVTFAGIPMLNLRAPALSHIDRIIKRAFDIVVGSFLIIIFLPLITLSAVAILLDDGWPFIYKQERIGEKGRRFYMYKLRSMVKNADQIPNPNRVVTETGETIFKTRNDPRITRVGRFIRRFSIDELPQFVNVILGDMSLVGPRPEIPDLVEKYERWQKKRQSVPPGVTGWWQVTGRSDKAMHLHTEDDLYYVENYSIWLDIQILIRTVWVVLVGKGSY